MPVKDQEQPWEREERRLKWGAGIFAGSLTALMGWAVWDGNNRAQEEKTADQVMSETLNTTVGSANKVVIQTGTEVPSEYVFGLPETKITEWVAPASSVKDCLDQTREATSRNTRSEGTCYDTQAEVVAEFACSEFSVCAPKL